MIRIVDQLVALSLDEDNAEEMKLPLVPATASVTIEDTAELKGCSGPYPLRPCCHRL